MIPPQPKRAPPTYTGIVLPDGSPATTPEQDARSKDLRTVGMVLSMVEALIATDDLEPIRARVAEMIESQPGGKADKKAGRLIATLAAAVKFQGAVRSLAAEGLPPVLGAVQQS